MINRNLWVVIKIRGDNYTKNLDLLLFCKKIISFFIYVKLDIDISKFYKLVLAWFKKTELPLMKP